MRNRTHTCATTASLYDVDWIGGRAIEVFFAHDELAGAFGGSWAGTGGNAIPVASRPVTHSARSRQVIAP
jgi:hypothetical protein